MKDEGVGAMAAESVRLNVTDRVTAVAKAMPDAIALVEPLGYDPNGKRRYRQITFRELEDDSSRIAAGLCGLGVTPGTRLALLVRPGIDFLVLVIALFKAAAVIVLIDPGMGRRNLIRCLAEAEPEGFVAIPLVHAVRAILKRRFPKARLLVTVGRRWFWGGVTLEDLRNSAGAGGGKRPGAVWHCLTAAGKRFCRWRTSSPAAVKQWHTPKMQLPSAAATRADDPAAIIFTTGSTGPPKGVLYTHANLDAQIGEIQEHYQIRPGEIDLPCFPIFGLFNCAMGVTAVIPDMDPSHPARVDPAKIVEAVADWNVTQAFASPAVLARVGPYCRARGLRLAGVRRVLSAGAPVPAAVLAAMKDCIDPDGDIYTPYGATEALPVASIAASEVLAETAARTREGAGVCVGRKFPKIQWKVIRIVDGPIASLAEAQELPAGEIGELIVRGPVVTRQYVTRREANALGKILDGPDVWHRMGDAGYLDGQGRFWFCGRVAHRVITAAEPMYTIPCEAIFNQHPQVRRSALVGIGPAGQQCPVIVLEPLERRLLRSRAERKRLLAEVRQLGQTHQLTMAIRDFLLHKEFPVDVRHNAKIFREKLAAWAARKL